jgi:hypothetical protein
LVDSETKSFSFMKDYKSIKNVKLGPDIRSAE